MQRDLFTHTGFAITPESGRNQPRLWVRRLAIWSEAGQIIRDIQLRPGFNIVWSPDAGTSQTEPIGHGSGKTTFCRLLRYCLGEDAFATEGQRALIRKAFPKGYVGAEIMLVGRPWIVMRSLGERETDVVLEGGTFEDAFKEDLSPIRYRDIAHRHNRKHHRRCRKFNALVDWARFSLGSCPGMGDTRSGVSLRKARRMEGSRFDSKSPVRGRSEEDRLIVIRALIVRFYPPKLRHDKPSSPMREVQSRRANN